MQPSPVDRNPRSVSLSLERFPSLRFSNPPYSGGVVNSFRDQDLSSFRYRGQPGRTFTCLR